MVGAWLQSEDSVCVWDGGLTLEPWGLCPMFTIHPRLGDDRIRACPLGQISLWPQEGPRGTNLLTVPSIVSECEAGVQVSNRQTLGAPSAGVGGLQGPELPCSLWTSTNRSSGQCCLSPNLKAGAFVRTLALCLPSPPRSSVPIPPDPHCMESVHF